MSVPRIDRLILVAGHSCLDLIPDLGANQLDALLLPGKLLNVGRAVTATGGCVPNTGLALHKLGLPVRMAGKVGDDLFGKAILDALSEYDRRLADGMIVRQGEQSSYTIVISPQGADRIFLHHPGTNDTFGAEDITDEALSGVSLFHFGYPPLMKRMYEQEGMELERLLARVKAAGITVSLDMARPDPDSAAGRVDWRALLMRVLPQVDLFLPSLEELLFMLVRDRYEAWMSSGDTAGLLQQIDGGLLAELSGQLLKMGAAIAAIKLGDQGLYVRTTDDGSRLRNLGSCSLTDPGLWVDRELLAPCFQVQTAGTTGAGDCTIAGFLGGLRNGLSPEETMLSAVGVGACNVEAVDATSGIVNWNEVQRRIRSGWKQLPVRLPLSGWRWSDPASLWVGPNDRSLRMNGGIDDVEQE